MHTLAQWSTDSVRGNMHIFRGSFIPLMYLVGVLKTFKWYCQFIPKLALMSCSLQGFIKVHIFWEGHNFFAKSPPYLNLSYVVTVKFTVTISQNCVAFSEYMNFDSQFWIFQNFQPIIYYFETTTNKQIFNFIFWYFSDLFFLIYCPRDVYNFL